LEKSKSALGAALPQYRTTTISYAFAKFLQKQTLKRRRFEYSIKSSFAFAKLLQRQICCWRSFAFAFTKFLQYSSILSLVFASFSQKAKLYLAQFCFAFAKFCESTTVLVGTPLPERTTTVNSVLRLLLLLQSFVQKQKCCLCRFAFARILQKQNSSSLDFAYSSCQELQCYCRCTE
jgi:hypothetical protein